jgi:hypothetical protein
MTRREFTKRIGLLVAAATAIPSAAIAAAFDVPHVELGGLAVALPGNVITEEHLSVTGLQKAFGIAWYGNRRPTLMLMSQENHDLLLHKIIPSARIPSKKRAKAFLFNGADCVVYDKIPSGEVWLINEAMPREPKLNSMFKIIA